MAFYSASLPDPDSISKEDALCLSSKLSVFVENKSGRLAEITRDLSKANIDIRALSVADTTHFGILRPIVNRPDAAEEALRNSGLTVSLTNVIAISVPDHPGGFAQAARSCATWTSSTCTPSSPETRTCLRHSPRS